MTERMRASIIEWAKLIGAATVITSVASGVLSFIVSIVFFVWGAQLLTAAGVATSQEMAAMKQTVDDLLRRVTVLARPDQIAHYRDLPVALHGECYPGEECTIVVFAERDIRALECRIIPGRTELLLTQEARTFTVPAVQRGTAVNLGPSPRGVEPTFLLPRSLDPGEATARIISHYTGCLWQIDGQPPVSQESPQFRITIGEMR